MYDHRIAYIMECVHVLHGVRACLRATRCKLIARMYSRGCLGHHRKGSPGIGHIDYVLNVG